VRPAPDLVLLDILLPDSNGYLSKPARPPALVAALRGVLGLEVQA
jgi:CheY-like chemotaxis protein